MSDEINEFDQLFRDRLSDQTATPPPAVWDNIQSTRTFGHVVANRISTNWRVFGTLLMLLLAGGSSFIIFGGEQSVLINAEMQVPKKEIKIQETNTQKLPEIKEIKTENKDEGGILTPSTTQFVSVEPKAIQKITKRKQQEETYHFPEADILASLQQAAFIRPEISDERLAAYIENLDGWESASPKGFTHYYNMDEMQKLGVFKNTLNAVPLSAVIDYDYVMPKVEKKTFKERSSIVFAITPHSIYKTLRAEYNLSSSFLEERQKAEKVRLAYTASVLLHYEIKNHKFLESGINFTQIYEEVSFEGKKRFSNKSNFLEIPFLMGFQDRNAKWGWHIKGGFGVQLYNTYSGYTLKRMDDFGSEETPQYRMSAKNVIKFIENDHRLTNNQARNELVNLENKNENPYKTSGVVNVYLATGLTYYHSDKVSFLLTPSYKRSVNSLTKERANFSEKISYTGISFGTLVKF